MSECLTRRGESPGGVPDSKAREGIARNPNGCYRAPAAWGGKWGSLGNKKALNAGKLVTISECLQGGERGETHQEIIRRAVQRNLETVKKCLYGGRRGKPGVQGVLPGY